MRAALWKICHNLQALTLQEEGQDLVEYALVISLVAVGCVSGLTPLATSIKSVFTTIKGSL